MRPETLYQQVLDYANRPNPYPLYAELRKTPVIRQEDGTYTVSTYREIVALLHDPRISSDLRKRPRGEAAPAATPVNEEPSFLTLDPPEHDRLRRQAMRHFGPPNSPYRVGGMAGEFERIVNQLINGLKGKQQIDLVDDFAYPFPVTVICELLGVPHEDEPRFHVWAEALVANLDPDPRIDRAELQRKTVQAATEMSQYMAQLIEAHSQHPGDDMLSGMATDADREGRMSLPDMIHTANLLLIAGHETTVNLITNGMLTLLRHPDTMQRLRDEPELVVSTVEELLRYEPPVQLLPNRTALDDIAVGDTVIPKGSAIALMLAAGNRDPNRFPDADQFIPDRQDNQHLGFGSGIHNCFGAPLARLEVQTALTALIRRLDNPRLVEDPPPYRQNPTLRGPRHLLIEIDGLRD